jgi:hypothetical protein
MVFALLGRIRLLAKHRDRKRLGCRAANFAAALNTSKSIPQLQLLNNGTEVPLVQLFEDLVQCILVLFVFLSSSSSEWRI